MLLDTLSNPCKKQGASIQVAACELAWTVLAHVLLHTRGLLGEMFRESLAWPALSPDSSPNEYDLLGKWESLVAQENPTDATTLRAAIIKTDAKITCDQIKRMIWHFTSRLRLCLATDGGYFAASLR